MMTVQPPLPLAPGGARPVGAAAAIIEDDDDGGRVFVHGSLAYAWDAGDTAARRFAAVSLVKIKAATQLEVAEAFAVKLASVRRWGRGSPTPGWPGCSRNRKAPNASRNSPPPRSWPSPGCATVERPAAPSPRKPGCRRAASASRCCSPTPTAMPRSRALQQVRVVSPSPSPSPSPSLSPGLGLGMIALQRFPMIRTRKRRCWPQTIP
jgi:hypothetical protein